jgi:hypothetical protein
VSRKQVLNLSVVIVATFLISAVLVALIPVWASLLLVKPHIMDQLSDKATQAAIRFGTRAMFNRTPTQPMGVIRW